MKSVAPADLHPDPEFTDAARLLAAVVRTAAKDAQRGDRQARRWLQTFVGKPDANRLLASKVGQTRFRQGDR